MSPSRLYSISFQVVAEILHRVDGHAGDRDVPDAECRRVDPRRARVGPLNVDVSQILAGRRIRGRSHQGTGRRLVVNRDRLAGDGAALGVGGLDADEVGPLGQRDAA